uniref:Kinesin-like protein n=1 Tax=Auxenochlorella protothecoides TaxID=3075 RepID=A0A1D2ACD9_AUXPR
MASGTIGPDEAKGPGHALVLRLVDRIRQLEHQIYSNELDSRASSSDTDATSRLGHLMKRAQAGLDSGLAYILGEEEVAQANQDAARIREAEEACADLQARLDAARTQVQKDAVHIMHLTRQLDAERQNAAAERMLAGSSMEAALMDARRAAHEEAATALGRAEARAGEELAAAVAAATQNCDREAGELAGRAEALEAALRAAEAGAERRAAALSAEAAAAQEALRAAAAEVDLLRSGRAALAQELNETRVRLERALAAADDFHARFLQERAERRKVHEELQSLRGNIRVLCRLRPLAGGPGAPCALEVPFPGTLRVRCGDRRTQEFEFGTVADAGVSQAELFEEVAPLVRSVADGHNVCIFAYGQTGSGKTHTVTGPAHDPGLAARAADALCALASAEGAERRALEVGMLEVYGDVVRDLLAGPDGAAGAALEVSGLGPGQVADCRARVPGLGWRPVAGREDVLALLREGCAARATAGTALNAASSRSHAVLSIRASDPDGLAGASVLHLVDLAGSERVARSEVTGQQLREAQAINKSLSALGDVMAALATRAPHVPFRNSRLTQVLQDSLCGSSKVLLVCCLDPDPASAPESLSSLAFAARAARVELGASTPSARATPSQGRAEGGTPGTGQRAGTPLTGPGKDEEGRRRAPRTPLHDLLNTPPPALARGR